jgi:hypothetical protein
LHEPTEEAPALELPELEAEAHKLIDLALLVWPEGEGLDLTDRGYSLEEVVRLKTVLSRMRKGIDFVNKALAVAWYDQFGMAQTIDLDDEHWWIAPERGFKFQPGMARPFAEWLKAQDPEQIEALIPDYGLRRGALPKAARDTFFQEPQTSADSKIKSKPRKGKK